MRIKIGLEVILYCFILSLAGCDRLEIVDSYYPKFEDLRKSNEPGNWIPMFIPHSATEIKERHKIDTGAIMLSFRFTKRNDLSLADHCDRVEERNIELLPAGFLNVNWWPYLLFNKHTEKNDIHQYEFYRCKRQAFLAVTSNDSQYQAYYWRKSLN